MTFDEMNRAIESLLQNQANAAIRMDETDRQIRKLTESTSRFQEEMRGFIKILVPILEIQSRRLDRLEGFT